MALCSPASIQKQPIRLAMKLTVSLACTTPLPRPLAEEALEGLQDHGRPWSSPGTSSTSFITLTGLKKWVTARVAAAGSAGRPFASARSGMPEVLVLTTEPIAAQRREALEQPALGREILDHRFADPVVVGNRVEVLGEAAGGDPPCRRRIAEQRRAACAHPCRAPVPPPRG